MNGHLPACDSDCAKHYVMEFEAKEDEDEEELRGKMFNMSGDAIEKDGDVIHNRRCCTTHMCHEIVSRVGRASAALQGFSWGFPRIPP
jgi:hypothetical protein